MLDIYDSTARYQPRNTVLDEHITHSDPVLVESAWVDSIDPKPPDESTKGNITDTDTNADTIDPDRLATEYRYHLRVKALKLDRTGNIKEKQFQPVEGLTEGNDWVLNPTNDNWYVPAMDLPDEQTTDIPLEHMRKRFFLTRSISTDVMDLHTKTNKAASRHKYRVIQAQTLISHQI